MADADILPPDVRAEIERFDARAQKIIVSFVGPLESQPPPPTIYHYTNEAGLRGILESGMIWLTEHFRSQRSVRAKPRIFPGGQHHGRLGGRWSAGEQAVRQAVGWLWAVARGAEMQNVI